MHAVDLAASAGEGLPVRYAVLACDLAPPAAAQRRASPDSRRAAQNLRLAASLSRRLKAPTECRDLARLAARHRTPVERAAELTSASLLDLLLAVDALRRPGRFEQFLRACALDWSSRSRQPAGDYPAAALLRAARDVVCRVDAGAIAGAGTQRADLVLRIRAARLKALRAWRGSASRQASR
jgi:tRNA nucleotidyltransferase (CCA-adding enzyme)